MSREALRAGDELATAEMIRIRIIHKMKPSQPMAKVSGLCMIVTPTTWLMTIPTGKAKMTPKTQLIKPISMPSTITIDWIERLEAPMARITPNSRMRSMTFRLMVLAKPRPADNSDQDRHTSQEDDQHVGGGCVLAGNVRRSQDLLDLDIVIFKHLFQLIGDALLRDGVILVGGHPDRAQFIGCAQHMHQVFIIDEHRRERHIAAHAEGADDLPLGILLIDFDGDLVAYFQIRAGFEQVIADDDGILVFGNQPAPGGDGGVN